MVVRTQPCPAGVAPATTEIRAFSQNLGQNDVYGQARFAFSNVNGHIAFNTPTVANPTFFVNEFYVSIFGNTFDEQVVKHELGHGIGLAHDDRPDPAIGGPKIMRPVNFGTPTEVNPWERITLDFLYGHVDASDGNSGDSTPPAGANADPPAFDPDATKLKAGGKGAKVRKRYGEREVVELRNEGNGITSATITVYATAAAAGQAVGG
jgi:hypothetical protein